MNPVCEVIAISSDEDEIDEYTIVSVKRKRSAEEQDDADGDCLIIDGKSENVAASTEYAEIGVDVPDKMLFVGEKRSVRYIDTIDIIYGLRPKLYQF